MDIRNNFKNIFPLIKKYRYTLMIVAIGLILMTIPGIGEKNQIADNKTPVNKDPLILLEEKLSATLSLVEGAGEVKVVLTVSEGEEVVYQTNDNTSNSSDSTGSNKDTVTVTDAERNQTGLVRQINPVVYKGAIIVCQGADDLSVRLMIVEAISKLTGLGANCISVMKMK